MQIAGDARALLEHGDFLRLRLEADRLEARRRLADQHEEELEIVPRELVARVADHDGAPAQLVLDQHGRDEQRLGGRHHRREIAGDRPPHHRTGAHVVAQRRRTSGTQVVGEESLGGFCEGHGTGVVLGDAQADPDLAAGPCDVPGEVAPAVRIAQHERTATGSEELHCATSEAGDRASGAAAAPHRRHQVEHEAQLALRASLVLPEVADQVSRRQQIERAEEMGAMEGEVLVVGDATRHEDGERIEQGQHDGDRHRGRQAPADADARDHEDVQQEEGAGSALREERDHRHPDHVRDRREVPDPVLAHVLAPDHEETARG